MKHEQTIGKQGQYRAASALRSIGVEMVEKIATPVLLIPSAHKGLFRPVFEEPVSGDHRGILHDGTSVLAETKTILDRNLRYSDLREHQPARLTEHDGFGGRSLLVWVHSSGVYVMEWPIIGFDPGTSITPEEAQHLNIKQL